jgi:hypothetical protein
VRTGWWPGCKAALRRAMYGSVLVLLAAIVGSPLVVLSQAAEETPEVLPPGPGREETFYGCTACHGTAIIRQQGMTRERWDETLRVMTDKHGMAAYEGELRDTILDYLATQFPPRRRAPANPFLAQ